MVLCVACFGVIVEKSLRNMSRWSTEYHICYYLPKCSSNINLQSIVNKVQEFHCLLDAENPDIVIGSESWRLPDISSSEIFQEGYQSFRADRKSKALRNGGVSIFVKIIGSEQP